MDFQLLAGASLVVMTLVGTVTGDAGATSVTGAPVVLGTLRGCAGGERDRAERDWRTRTR